MVRTPAIIVTQFSNVDWPSGRSSSNRRELRAEQRATLRICGLYGWRLTRARWTRVLRELERPRPDIRRVEQPHEGWPEANHSPDLDDETAQNRCFRQSNRLIRALVNGKVVRTLGFVAACSLTAKVPTRSWPCCQMPRDNTDMRNTADAKCDLACGFFVRNGACPAGRVLPLAQVCYE